MGELANLWMGFQIAISPYNLGVAVIGIVLGTIIGVLPGLGGANGGAILLPVTFTIPPPPAAVGCGPWWGASVRYSFLITPGEPWSVAPAFDAHPLAKQGHGGQA